MQGSIVTTTAKIYQTNLFVLWQVCVSEIVVAIFNHRVIINLMANELALFEAGQISSNVFIKVEL